MVVDGWDIRVAKSYCLRLNGAKSRSRTPRHPNETNIPVLAACSFHIEYVKYTSLARVTIDILKRMPTSLDGSLLECQAA